MLKIKYIFWVFFFLVLLLLLFLRWSMQFRLKPFVKRISSITTSCSNRKHALWFWWVCWNGRTSGSSLRPKGLRESGFSFKHLLKGKTPVWRKVMWMVIIIIGVIYSSYNIKLCADRYYSYPSTIKPAKNFSGLVRFPKITACLNSMHSRHKLEAKYPWVIDYLPFLYTGEHYNYKLRAKLNFSDSTIPGNEKIDEYAKLGPGSTTGFEKISWIDYTFCSVEPQKIHGLPISIWPNFTLIQFPMYICRTASFTKRTAKRSGSTSLRFTVIAWSSIMILLLSQNRKYLLVGKLR